MVTPNKVEMRGKKVSNLIKALSLFPKNAKFTLKRQYEQSYNIDKVFTLTYDKDFKEVTIKEIY